MPVAKNHIDRTVLNLLKQTLGYLDPADITQLENLRGDVRRKFLFYCHETFSNPHFEMIIDAIVGTQLMHAALEGETNEKVQAGRNMALGMGFLRDIFAKYSAEYEKLVMEQPEQFDPQAVTGGVNPEPPKPI